MKRFTHVVVLSLMVLVFFVFGSIHQGIARDLTIEAGANFGFSFYNREYFDNNSAPEEGVEEEEVEEVEAKQDDDYRRVSLTPLIVLKSLTARDEISFSYAPTLRYDFNDDNHDIDHYLSLTTERFLTENWKISLFERYRMSDMVEDQEGSDRTDSDTSDSISDNDGRRQYWTNNLGVKSEYSYFEESVFGMGYTYNILREIDEDKNSGYENYDKHNVNLFVDHRLTSQWVVTASGKYIRGLYDTDGLVGESGADDAGEGEVAETEIDNDLTEYLLAAGIESSLFDHHPLSLNYSSSLVSFDDDTNNVDSEIHNITLGWQWLFSSNIRFNLGGGPSFAQYEGEEGQWGTNGQMGLSYEQEHSVLTFSADGGYDRQNFSGTDENGLQEYWQSRLNFRQEILQDLSWTLFASYRYQDTEEVLSIEPESDELDAELLVTTETINKEIYSAGTSVNYSFWQYYNLSFSYAYKKQYSDKADDSYDTHLVSVMLGTKQEIFKW